jgi:hypothetical protein
MDGWQEEEKEKKKKEAKDHLNDLRETKKEIGSKLETKERRRGGERKRIIFSRRKNGRHGTHACSGACAWRAAEKDKEFRLG